MKNTLTLIIGVLFLAVGCVEINPGPDPIDDIAKELEERREKAEADLNSLTITANGLSCLVSAFERKVTIDAVESIAGGWTISFSDGTTATIKSEFLGTIPTIGITTVEDLLVWSVNGTVIKDKDGNPVSVAACVPEFVYEEDVWKYRILDGAWIMCGAAGGEGLIVSENDDFITVTVGDTVIKIEKTVDGVTVGVEPLPIV